MVDLLCHL